MANQKRQRQDLARTQKLAREAEVKARQVRKTRNIRFAVVGAVLAAIVIGLLVVTSRGGTDTSSAPTVTVPSGAKPTSVQTKDLRVGTGETVQKGDTIRVKYTGVAWSTKAQFDSNWGSDQPYVVEAIGVEPRKNGVIQGWDALIGAKVGGRRQLIIPPDKAYGAAGRSPIGPNETLIFVVDIVSREKA